MFRISPTQVLTGDDIGSARSYRNGEIAARTAIAVGDSPYTALAADVVIAVDCSGGPITVNLPTAVGIAGKSYTVKDESGDAATSNITIDGNGGETIDGALTYVINTDRGEVTIYSDGANWQVADNAAEVARYRLGFEANVTDIAVGDSPYTALADDVLINVDCSGGPVTINLPAGVENKRYKVVDEGGDAATSNITITPNGAETIDGAASLVLKRNYSSAELVFANGEWHTQAARAEVLERQLFVLPKVVRLVAGDSPYSVVADDVVIACDTGAGAIAVNLPAAAGMTDRWLFVKDEGGAAGGTNITIDGNGGETIDGALTLVLAVNYDGCALYCDGSNWFTLPYHA